MAPSERRVYHGDGKHVAVTVADGVITDITTRDRVGTKRYPKGSLAWYVTHRG